MPKSDLPDRLHQLVEVAGSQRKFAELVGKTAAAVNGWLHGATPYQSTLDQIADRTEVSSAWLARGEGDDETETANFRRRLQSGGPRPRRAAYHPEEISPDLAAPGELQLCRIPVLSFAQAGAALSSDCQAIDDYESLAAFAVKDRRAIAVRLRGDSMAPDYQPGTIAILYPSYPPRSENLVMAKLRDGSVIFKRLHIVGDKFHFLSINPAYAPIVVTADEIERMYVVGKTERDEL